MKGHLCLGQVREGGPLKWVLKVEEELARLKGGGGKGKGTSGHTFIR